MSICFVDRTSWEKEASNHQLAWCYYFTCPLIYQQFSMRLHTPHSALVSSIGPSHFTNYTCSDYSSAGNSAVWDCMKCFEVFVTRLWVLCFNSWQGKTQCWTQTTLFLAVPGIVANFSCLLFLLCNSYFRELVWSQMIQQRTLATEKTGFGTQGDKGMSKQVWFSYTHWPGTLVTLHHFFFLQERAPCHGLSTLRYCGVCMWRNSSNS